MYWIEQARDKVHLRVPSDTNFGAPKTPGRYFEKYQNKDAFEFGYLISCSSLEIYFNVQCYVTLFTVVETFFCK
jgi:hypothetical protein